MKRTQPILLLLVLSVIPLLAGCTHAPAIAAPSDAVACDLALATLYATDPPPTPPAPAPEPDGDTGAIGKEAGGIRGLIDAGTQAARKVSTAADRGDAIMQAFQRDGILVKPAKPTDVRLIPMQVAQCPGGTCPVPRVSQSPAAIARQPAAATTNERRGLPILRRLCRRCG